MELSSSVDSQRDSQLNADNFCGHCRRIYFGQHQCRAGGPSVEGVSGKRRQWNELVRSVCNDSCPHWGVQNGSKGCLLSPTKPCDIGMYQRQGKGCFADPPRYHAFDQDPPKKRAPAIINRPQPTAADGPIILKEWHNPIDAKEPFQVIIKSMLRWQCVERLVASIKRWYPKVEILIADDSWIEVPSDLPAEMQRVLGVPGVHWWQIQHDYGLPASRNFLARCASAEYIINCDDDFVFTRETEVHKMVELLQANQTIDVAAGQVRMDAKNAQSWNGRFEWEPHGEKRRLRINPLPNEYQRHNGTWFRETDLGWNFLCARRKFLVDNPADEHFRIIGEHLDRYLDWHEKGVRIVELPNVIIGHVNERPQGYRGFRQRKTYYNHLMRKWRMSQPAQHPATQIPAMPQVDVRQVMVDQLRNRPNVVLMTIGHTGSSIVARMMGMLGWQLGDADDEYSESVSVREINQRRQFSRCGQVLSQLPEPWVIKDPRFCEHLDKWLPALQHYSPTLVWLTRDIADVEQSYRKRGENWHRARERQAMAQTHWYEWRGPKVQVSYEDVRAAVRAFTA